MGRRCPSQRGGAFFKLLVLLLILGTLAAVYMLRHPLLSAAGSLWIVDEPPQPADVIVLLGDDNYWADRAGRAAELYHARWAPRVVVSGRYLRPYLSNAELMQRDLTERGVPAEAVVRFAHHASSTREEALAMRRLLNERRWLRVLVVTSNFHTRRTRYIYRRVLGPEAQLRVVAAQDKLYDPNAWWKSREGVRLFFRESVAFCVAVWEMRRSDSVAPVTRAIAPAGADSVQAPARP